ncbi:MAG: hypothetical protein JO218_03130 [Burkholderiales bacterium]|nr:hypothetical protein [Burkholderiales bacterium]
MQNQARHDEEFVYTYATMRPYLGRILLNVSHVDWRDLQESSYVLDDVREALDACVDYVQRQPAADVEGQLEAIERVYSRLKSAESAPSIHRPHAGLKLAREYADFVGRYYISAPSGDVSRVAAMPAVTAR